MTRDNFPSQIIERLQKSVASRCSNPDCRVQTVAAGTESGSVTSIGEAAHISAASAGGLRFQASMNAQERISFGNAIWLCANCHKKVDRDEAAYPASLLHEWKKQAELKARQELGQKLPSDSDAQNLLLSAFGAVPGELSRSAITNVHRAVQQHLETLDPRFLVKTTFDGSVTHHLVSPIEPVFFTLTVNGKSKADFLLQHKNMINHAATAVFAAGDVTAAGSDLLRYVLAGNSNSAGTITLKPHSTRASLKLHLLDPLNNLIEPFDDMPGEVVAGKQSLTFSGANCGGTLQMVFKKYFLTADDDEESEFGPNFQPWDGADVRNLPFSDKLAHLFQQLKNLKTVQFALEVDGKELLSGGLLNATAGLETADAVLNTIQHAKNVGLLASHLNVRVNFSAGHCITSGESSGVIEALETFSIQRAFGRNEIRSNPVVAMTMSDDFFSTDALRNGSIIEVEMHEKVGQQSSVFGQIIDLPPRKISISGATAKLLDGLTHVKAGDKVRVELQPNENFKYFVQYIS